MAGRSRGVLARPRSGWLRAASTLPMNRVLLRSRRDLAPHHGKAT